MRPNVYYTDSAVTLWHGDSIETMRELPDNSIDSIVTDPPYGLGFMGKEWDALPPGEEWAAECLRVLKPGGHLLAFGGSRTWHRLAVAVEDAGFEIRDSIAWLYGSGFPKSLDVSKAIDKAAGAEREVTGRVATPFKVDAAASRGTSLQGSVNGDFSKQADESGYRYTEITAPATPAAAEWQGWGTALKPAFEPVVVGRKPLQGTVAQNVQAYGTGALNIDECRIDAAGEEIASHHQVNGAKTALGTGWHDAYKPGDAGKVTQSAGRWPANVVLDETTAPLLDQQSGTLKTGGAVRKNNNGPNTIGLGLGPISKTSHSDEGGASRFFYVARKDDECLTGQPSSIANTAAASSPRPNLSVVSALDDAATSARPDTAKPTDSRSTNGMPIESKPNGPSNTAPTTPTESASSPGQQPDDTTPTRTPANSAANPTPTDTTTTTTSPSISAGAAESTISSTMQPSKEHGDTVSGLRDDARFMYVAKAPKKERPVVDGVAHPTVKPLSLLRWLVKLVTPPGGVVLDPFEGSGTTLEACLLEGFNHVGIEREADYLPLIMSRIDRQAGTLPHAA